MLVAEVVRGCSPAPNAADRARFEAFKQIGCIACWKDGVKGEPHEVHHVRQDDNQQTLPLCSWHHRGDVTKYGDVFKGPSMAVDKRAFVKRYGTEHELLLYINELVEYVQ